MDLPTWRVGSLLGLGYSSTPVLGSLHPTPPPLSSRRRESVRKEE